MFKDDKFSFWCPVGCIEKATDENGAPVMRIGGIASTIDEDADGESLDPSGFDIEPLKKSGMVNWHHQAKNSPASIIGEPSKVELRPEGLWIESDLYSSSPMACEVYELAKTLEQNSKTRRLGYSIEGKVLKRASDDKKSPLYKKIQKAVITGVAVTHMPKNPHTFVNIIKGQIDVDNEQEDFEEDEEKATTTESAAPLKKESVDGVKNQVFSKSCVMERIFRDIPNITIPNAESVYNLIKSISAMNKKKSITAEDIEKAYAALEITPTRDIEEDVNKGDDSEGQMGEEDETHDDEPRKVADPEETEGEAETDDDEVEESKGGKVKKGRDDSDIMKAIAGIGSEFKTYIRATAVLINDLRQKRAEDAEKISALEDIIKGQSDTINSFSERLESYGNSVPRPKSLRSSTVVDRNFSKGGNSGETIEKGKSSTVISMSKNPQAIAALLDQATFAKGFDAEYSNATLRFEASRTLPSTIIARIKAETGYEIVD